MACECLGAMAGFGPDNFGRHHHKNCTGYEQEKHRVLFYYEAGVDCWVPALDADFDCVAGEVPTGEIVEIQFKYIEITDKELAELPDV